MGLGFRAGVVVTLGIGLGLGLEVRLGIGLAYPVLDMFSFRVKCRIKMLRLGLTLGIVLGS